VTARASTRQRAVGHGLIHARILALDGSFCAITSTDARGA
jgi:hypothetical protein